MDKTSTNWKACSVRMVILDPKFSPKSYIAPQFSVSPKHVSSFANLHFKSIDCNLFIVIMDQSFLLSEPCCKSFLKEKKRQMDRLFRVALFVVSRKFLLKTQSPQQKEIKLLCWKLGQMSRCCHISQYTTYLVYQSKRVVGGNSVFSIVIV